jgi:hypothetical protein
MAIPTLTAVSPVNAPTFGGYEVRLTGTNFRRAPQPPPAGYTATAEQQTVAVWFDGVRARRAIAASATEVLAIVPTWRGSSSLATPHAVDVTVANLNDAGAIIAGETATLAAGFAYDRPSLVKSTPLQRVMEETVALLRRHVLANTHWIRSRDYDDATADHADALPAATLPRLDLVGPTLVPAPEWGTSTPTEVATSSTAWERPIRQRTVHLDWTLDGFTADAPANQAIALANAVADFFAQVAAVTIPADPAAPTGAQWAFEMELSADGAPVFDVAPQGDGLRHFRCEFQVRGVDLGAEDLPVTETGTTVFDADAPTITTEAL